MDEILNLIKAGKTPDQIYQEAKAAAKKIDDEKKEAENKRKNRRIKKNYFEQKRKEFLNALVDYVKIVAGEAPDNRVINMFNKELNEIENAVLDSADAKVKVDISTKEVDADKIIDQFLKDLGF